MAKRPLAIVLAVTFLACVHLRCHHESSGGSPTPSTRIALDISGRKISAVVNGPVIVHQEGDDAVFGFGSHEVQVGRERVLLDGAEIGKLSSNAAEIQIVVDSKGLNISADGKIVATKKIV